jgi:hypothetical protein
MAAFSGSGAATNRCHGQPPAYLMSPGEQEPALASEMDTALTFPCNFTPLPDSRRSCGRLSPAVLSEALSSCQRPAVTQTLSDQARESVETPA